LKKGQEAVQEKLSKPQTSSQMSSWAHRSESMKVQHSQPEIDLMKELSALGITPETNQTVSLWWTIPDGLYRDKKVVYYVHGVVHDKGKALAKDDEIEAALLQLG
jgi:G:T-mismatch repair DNA endonuclease (very short patch repair protein)